MDEWVGTGGEWRLHRPAMCVFVCVCVRERIPVQHKNPYHEVH